MQELEALRMWLAAQSGHLTAIATRTGISRRTVQRIVNDDGYSVNLKTFSALKAEMERLRSEEAAAA